MDTLRNVNLRGENPYESDAFYLCGEQACRLGPHERELRHPGGSQETAGMNAVFSHHVPRITKNNKMMNQQCPHCGSAISSDYHYCAECGAKLIVCYARHSPNVGHSQFCSTCRQPTLSPVPNKTSKILGRTIRDFTILEQAANAIVKLQRIIESIERLELVHQIECSQIISVARKPTVSSCL